MTDRKDPYTSYRFLAEIGSTAFLFTECHGLEVEIQYEEVVEGGLNSYIHRLPKRVARLPNLVLKRGLAGNELWEWHKNTMNGTIERRDVSIILYGYDGMADIRWNINKALPAKWIGPSFNAGENQVAFETLELIHNGVERA